MKTILIGLLALGSTSVVGLSMLENPKEDINNTAGNVSDWFVQLYDKVLDGEHNKILSTIISAVGTVVIWLIVFVIVGLLKARSARQELSKIIAEKKSTEKKSTEWSITHQIIVNEEQESEIIKQAKARILYQQLRQDLTILEGRIKWLPEEIDAAKCTVDQLTKIEAAHKRDYDSAADECKRAHAKYIKLSKELIDQRKEIEKITKEIDQLKVLI